MIRLGLIVCLFGYCLIVRFELFGVLDIYVGILIMCWFNSVA